MKRIILTLMAVFICTLLPAKGLSVVSGSIAVLKENSTSTFELDLTNSTFERKENFKEWCGLDYDERVYLMKTTFPERFNEKTKGLRIVPNDEMAKYKIVLHISNFVRKLGAFYGASAWIRIDGTLTITEVKSGKEVLKCSIEHFQGDQDFKETDRFPKVVKALAEKLHKLK